MSEVPHLKWPLEFAGTGMVVIEQDTLQEVEQCVEILLRCPTGFREELPQFGVEDQTFRENGVDLEMVANVVATWEPRADAEVTSDFDLEALVSKTIVKLKRRNISG